MIVFVQKSCFHWGALWREPKSHLRATMPAGTQVQFWPAVVSRSSPHLFTPPHFLSKILHCPIQIKPKKPINKSLKKKFKSISPPIYGLHCPRGHRFKSGLMSFPCPLPTSSPPCFLSHNLHTLS